MADNVQLNAGTGGVNLSTDEISVGLHVQRVKAQFGADGSASDVATGNPLPVQFRNSGGTEIGTAAAPVQVTLANTGANATAVKTDGSAVAQPVTDNGGSLTMDFSGQKTLDYDSGAGTDTVLGVGILLPKSGGAVAGGTSSDPLRVDPTGTTAQPITDNSGSLTIDSPQLPSSLGQANMAGSISVTIASNQSNVPTNLAQVNGATVSTAASGVQKVGIVGNAGATVDSTVGAGSAPTNQIVVGSIYNTSAPAPTNGQAMALQADQAGNVRTAPGIALTTLSVWNSGTSLNATQNIFTNSGVPAALVYTTQSGGTFSAGAVTFEITYDGSTWATISADAVLDPTSATLATQAVPYTLVSATNKAFLVLSKGAQGLRIKLSTAITGTGTTTPNYALLAYAPVQQTVLGAGSATIGALTANQSINVAQIAGTSTATGNGTASAGCARVTIASDNTAFTTNATQSGTWTVQPGNTANSTPWLVTPTPATSGGYSISRALSANSNNATNVKGSAGQVFGWYLYNANAAVRYLKLYNKATSPTVGTDTPVMTIPIPPGSAANVEFGNGIPFGTGIGFGIVTGVADNDNTSVAANEIIVNLFYK